MSLYTKITWPCGMIVLLGSYAWPLEMDIGKCFRQLDIKVVENIALIIT